MGPGRKKLLFLGPLSCCALTMSPGGPWWGGMGWGAEAGLERHLRGRKLTH